MRRNADEVKNTSEHTRRFVGEFNLANAKKSKKHKEKKTKKRRKEKKRKEKKRKEKKEKGKMRRAKKRAKLVLPLVEAR